MDLKEFDLERLQTLHISFRRVLNGQEKQLADLQSTEEKEELTDQIIELLELKILSFKEQIKLIENRINELNALRLRFSVEFMFWHYGTSSRSVQVHFITTSNAYEVYGPYVTGQVLFDKNVFPELIENVKQGQHNDGIIKFEEIPQEIKEILKTEGFYASEIDCIF